MNLTRCLYVLFFGFGSCLFASLSQSGDIAFTAYSPSEENFAFVTFVDIGMGQSIFFDDEEWNGVDAFTSPTSEGNVRWTNSSGSVIAAGTVITLQDVGNNAGGLASLGTVMEVNGGFNGSSIDGVFAYLGADRTPSAFLAGIGDASSSSGLTSLNNTGLALGVNALNIHGLNSTPGDLFVEYTGIRSGLPQLSDYRSLLNNPENWEEREAVASGGFNSISFIPEPSTLLLLLLGMLLFARSFRC